ncbi:MAG: hypothetical protein AAGJ93_07565 [Bacteroidota bacterium]
MQKKRLVPGHENSGLSKEEFDRMLSDLKSGSDELYQLYRISIT